jgi:hypothetical protein
MSSTYNVVPQDFNDYEEYHDDYEDDPESRLSFDEPSIVSITVSRQEKPDGSIVRVKETFLSDGTSYREETAVPRRDLAAGGASGRIVTSTSTNTNQSPQSQYFYRSHKPSRKHSYEILPTHFMTDKPEPLVLHHKMALPQSKDPRSRMMYYVCCRCALFVSALLLVALLFAWLLLGENGSSLLEMLHNVVNPQQTTDRQWP